MSEKPELGTCDDFNSPHEYSAMTCKHWEPVASPQATRPDESVEFVCEHGTGHYEGEHVCCAMRSCAAQPAAGTTPCEICGEPLPAGEEMFKYHGYSGNCPNNGACDDE